nr:hypothetical protein [Tanacetum cinerariifolium]
MTTRSAGQPAVISRGGGTGGRTGRGDGRTGGRSGDQGYGRNEGQGGQVGGRGGQVAQVGGQCRGQGNGSNQNGDGVNDNIQGDVGNVFENNDCKGCTYKEFLACNPKEYDGKGGAIVYTRWIEKMKSVQDMSGCWDSQKMKYTAGSFVGKSLTWWNTQIHTRGRESSIGLAMLRILIGFMSWLATEPKTIQKVVQIAGALTDEALRIGSIKKNPDKRGKGGEPSKDRNVRDDNKMTRTGNAFAITVTLLGESTREETTRIMLGVEEAHHDLNIMTGTFTLNDHFATTLFDSGADHSFVSTSFISLLDIEPSDLGFSYEIEIAIGQLVEIDKVIKGCKLEIEGHVFDINLIPFGSESFDVIIGMDWLSDHKVKIIFHEKVVRIPLLDGKEIEFWIKLIPKAIPVAKSPYRLAPSELEELSDSRETCGTLRISVGTDQKRGVKSKTYDWVEEQENAFQTLKDKLCNAPILALYDGPEDFVVYCDASGLRLGCVLMQRGKSCLVIMTVKFVTIGKANVVADALSRKEKEEAFNESAGLKRGIDNMIELRGDGALYYLDQIWVPLKGDVRTLIMNEAHKSKYY